MIRSVVLGSQDNQETELNVTSSKKADIYVYSDGGAIGNPGPGGFGVVVEADGRTLKLSRGYRRTTNNRMELMGVIAGLESTAELGDGLCTEVVTDSRYVVDGMSRGWAKRWRANGWRRNKRGDMALNPDLWGRLLDAVEGRDVSFQWVRGHSGHPQNEVCDAIVGEASQLPNSEQLIDGGYEGAGGVTVVQPARFESLAKAEDFLPEYGGAAHDEDATSEPNLTHVDSSGAARMVNVSGKRITDRVAKAGCDILMSAKTLALIRSGSTVKGDVVSTAKLAGVMGAKRTSELIPMCHNIPISQIEINIDELADGSGLRVAATVRATWRTGVEIEALTGASVAALTVYDMCKSAERGIRVTNLRLLHKSGGNSGDYSAD